MIDLIISAVLSTQGKRVSRGRVAMFCPGCNEVSTFGAYDIFESNQMGKPVEDPTKWRGRELHCLICKLVRPYRHGLLTASQSGVIDIDELVDMTDPTLPDRMERRLNRLERAESGDAVARRRSIRMAVLAIDPFVRHRAIKHGIDLQTTAIILLSLALLVVVGVLWPSRAILGGILLGAGAVILWSVLTDRHRFIRRRFRSFLGDWLASLNPTAAELDGVLRTIDRRRRVRGGRIRGESIRRGAGLATTRANPFDGASR